MRFYLTETAPDRLEIAAVDICMEIRGSRGAFQISRLGEGEFIFRRSIAAGKTIVEAAESAMGVLPVFDASQALASLILSGIVTGEKGP
jgi:hypothetical protein